MKLDNFKKSNTLVALYVDSDGIKNTNELNNCFFSLARQNKKVDVVVFYNNLTTDEFSVLENTAKNPLLHQIGKDEAGNPTILTTPLNEGESINFVLIKNEKDNFGKLFNEGFNYSLTNEYEFYSFIEQEDSIASNWFVYTDSYFSEDNKLSVALPLIRNVVHGTFNSLINEAVWVEGLAEEAGVLDINLLLRYNVINILGAVFKVSAVKTVSEEKNGLYFPIKESIKFTNTYEFLLRMIYNDLRFKTIPRICYELKVINKSVYSHTSCKVPHNISQMSPDAGGSTPKEIQFYVDLAKKEYFFDNDRNVVFQ